MFLSKISRDFSLAGIFGRFVETEFETCTRGCRFGRKREEGDISRHLSGRVTSGGKNFRDLASYLPRCSICLSSFLSSINPAHQPVRPSRAPGVLSEFYGTLLLSVNANWHFSKVFIIGRSNQRDFSWLPADHGQSSNVHRSNVYTLPLCYMDNNQLPRKSQVPV